MSRKAILTELDLSAFGKSVEKKEQEVKFHSKGMLKIPTSATIEYHSDLDFTHNGKKIRFSKFSAPLFVQLPTEDDVHQGSQGDCSLLATLLAILHTEHGSKNEIMEMMQENEITGIVTVRLYDKENKPHFVSIDKSFPKHLSQKSAPWVIMVEKAIVCFLFKKDYKKLDTGLRTETILKAILGKEVEKGSSILKFDFNPQEPSLFEKVLDLGKNDGKTDTQNDFKFEILDEKELKIWNKLCESGLRDNWIKIVERIHNYSRTYLKLGTVRWEDCQKFMESVDCQGDSQKAEVLVKVINWIKEQNIYPGKRGTGIYTKEQKEVYKLIKTAIDDGKPITTGTYTVSMRLSAMQKKFGFLAGAKQKGIVPGHSYSIACCEEKVLGGNKLLGVVVHNPWNKYGRDYIQTKGKLISKSAQHGRFWVELSDFTKRFDDIAIGRQIGKSSP